MGFLSHRVDRSQIKLGDHIYTWRTAFTYSHHGIYVGGNKVVHFTTGQTDSSGSSGFSSSNKNFQGSCLSYPDCGFRQPGSGVVLSCLDCFIGTGCLYLFQYGIKKYVFISRLRGGTCTVAESDSPQEVFYRAMYLLQKGFGNYNLVLNNCEDFALYCKTSLLDQRDKGSSGQVNSWVLTPLTVIVASALKRFSCNPVAAVAATGIHCLNLYTTDIGVRDDVVKVNVEDMVLFRSRNEPLLSTSEDEIPLLRPIIFQR